jgi:TolB-like protein
VSALRPLVAVACVLAGAAPLLDAQCPDGTPPPCAAQRRVAPPPNSIAVLFFANAARDTSLDWLADALAEEVATELGAAPGLSVRGAGIVRNAWRVAEGDPRRVGQLTSVHYVVEGSYRRAGARIRVSARLLALPAGEQRWGRVYDRARDSLSTLSDDIAHDLASVLGAGAHRPGGRPPDPRAYEAYQRGRSSYLRNDVETARSLYEEAIRRDSTFAPAWAGLAEVWGEMGDISVPALRAYPRARAAAQRALALDPNLATAYLSVGFAVAALDRDCRGGDRWADRAIALDSALPEAWIYRSLLLACEDRGTEALGAVMRAWALDSLSAYTGIYFVYVTEMLEPQKVPAVLALVRARLAPDDARFWEGRAALQQGDCVRAEALMRPHGGTFLLNMYVASLVCLGRRAEADSIVRAAIADSLRSFVNPVTVAMSLLALGDRDGAMQWLERGADERSWWAMLIHVWSDLAPLHDDPRFVALERRLGLLP